MTFDEALQVLGLSGSDGVAAVRPAYLKLLRKHRPERDPEGFKRLRQALELVEAQPYLFVLRHGEQLGAQDRAITPNGSTGRARDPESAPMPTTLSDPLRELRARIAGAADELERLQLAEAGASQLQSAEAYALWVEVAEEIDDSAGLERALREACDAGFGQRFLPRLRGQFPTALMDVELDIWLAEAQLMPDASWTQLANTLIDRQRIREALDLGLRALAAAKAGAELQEWSAVFLALRLFETADIADAARFATALLAQRDPFSRVEPVRYAALGELVRLHGELGELLTQAIASALRSHDPGQADSTFQLLQDSEPRRARKLSKLLKRDAPTLYGLYRGELPATGWSWAGLRQFRSWRTPGRPLFTSGWMLIVIFNVIRCLMPGSSPTPVPRDRIDVHYETAPDGREQLVCTPHNSAFCERAQRFLLQQQCSLAQMDALHSLQQVASYNILEGSARQFYDDIIYKAKHQCGSTISETP